MRISDWSSDVCSSDLTLSAEHRRAKAEPALPEVGDEIGDEIRNDLFDCLGGGDRFEKPALGARHFERDDGHDRLGQQAARLVETLDRAAPEATRHRPVLPRVKCRGSPTSETPHRPPLTAPHPECTQPTTT